jgi:hypothetical protein
MSSATPTRSSDRARQPSAKVIAASASLAAPVQQTPPAKAKSSSTPPAKPNKKQRSAAPKTPDEPPQPPEPAPADAGAASLAAAADQWQLLWKTTHADLEAAKSREADLQQQLKDVTAKFDGLTTERNELKTVMGEFLQRELGHLAQITELRAQLEAKDLTIREKDDEIKRLNVALVEEQANAEAALAAHVAPVDLAKENEAAKQAVAGAQQQAEAKPEGKTKRGKAATDGTANVPIQRAEVIAGELDYGAIAFFKDYKINNVEDLAKLFFLKKKNECKTEEAWEALSDGQRYGKKTDATFEAKLCEMLLAAKGQKWVKVREDGKVVPDLELFFKKMYDQYTTHQDGTKRKWKYCYMIYPHVDPEKVDEDKAWTEIDQAGKSWTGNIGKCVTAGSYLEHWHKQWADAAADKKERSQDSKDALNRVHKETVKDSVKEAKRAEKAKEPSAALKKATKSITKQKPNAKPKSLAAAAAASVATGNTSD